MCSPLFSCMDQKHVIVREDLQAVGNLLSREPRDAEAASWALSLADRLSRITMGKKGGCGDEASPSSELQEATARLYDAAGEVLDAPTDRKCWEDFERCYHKTRNAFCRELKQLRRACGSAGVDPQAFGVG